jgi:fumarate reductase subunit C
MTLRAYVLQRLSAALMAPLVIVHIVVMIIAVQGGLSAAEILGRTQGSWLWGGFYSLFVIAAAIHASVGVANVIEEWLGWSRAAAVGIAHTLALVILVLGLRAVYAVVVV